MKKRYISPRPDKNQKLESIGFSFHGLDDYWQESRYYEFSQAQIDTIDTATKSLHDMCLEAVDYVIEKNLMSQMGIPALYHQHIKNSRHEPSLYGRFDLCYDGIHPPKMLEYNADTPVSLLESSLAQKMWQQEVFPQAGQYNYLHEKLTKRWRELGFERVTFTGMNCFEELICLHYLMQTAQDAGVLCDLMMIDELSYDEKTQYFLDSQNHQLSHIFKLYPYEFMMEDSFGPHLLETKTRFIEPIWKSILSNKAILPILYQMFPKSEYLLPSYYSPHGLQSYCKKPFFSREGSNIDIVSRDKKVSTQGPYQSTHNIYQEYCELPFCDGYHSVIGSWMVGDEPAGIYIRETEGPITDYMSHFIPHIVILGGIILDRMI